MKLSLWLSGLMALVVGVVLVVVLHIPLEVLLNWGAAGVCLGWLILLITLPWNVYFQARRVLVDLQRGRARGLEPDPERVTEVERLKTRSLKVSVLAHAVSAAVMALVTAATDGQVGYWFAGFYLLSTLFRPALKSYRYVHQRLRQVAAEAAFPPDDVAALKQRVTQLEGQMAQRLRQSSELAASLHGAERTWKVGLSGLEARVGAACRQVDGLIDRMADNQEIITGLRAFMRLVRGEGTQANLGSGG